MAVPYVFSNLPNGTAIPLSYLDANFSYLQSDPSFSGNVSVGGTLSVTGSATFSSTLTVSGHVTFEGVTSTGATGTGALVFGTSPTLTTPVVSGNVRQVTSATATSTYYDWGDGGTTFARMGGYYDSATTGHLELYALSTTLTEVVRVYGNGVSIKTGAAPTANLHLAAGTATAGTAPMKLNAGANMTVAEAGAVEYDGTAFYATSVGSSRQVVSSEQFVCVGATPVSLTNNSTSAQSVFAAANDALTLASTTTYFFEAYLSISTGSTTHTTAFGFGGTATFTSILYNAELVSSAANAIATSISTVEVISANATVLNATSAAVTTRIRLKGVMRVNAGGTIIPQITFSAGPTGTCQTNTNSFFRIWPVGTNTVEAVGNWA